ncbi:MAG: hypothetical protein M9894_22525 [Planctomycetes bacterium]|nr:hypothetical protein [Planctomycetota bacterium]
MSPPWWSRLVLIAAALAGLVAPAARADDAALAALEARAQDDPDAALLALEQVLRTDDLAPDARRRAERLRPRLLQAVGRLEDARAAWLALQRHGEDVAAPLLALAGARLRVDHTPPLAGAPLALTLEGERTGPLALRLYRVSAAGLRAAVEAEPDRGLDRHLRAPPSSALTRLGEWQAPEPGPGAPVTTSTPAPLEPGVFLLTVTARGVSVPLPLVLTRAVAVTGDGLLWLVDREEGAPLGRVAFRALGADGVVGRALGRTSAEGLLRVTGDAPAALAWLEQGEPLPLVVPLPPPAAPPPAAPPALALDLPVHRPGQVVRARAVGLPRDAPAQARLVDPRGVPVRAANAAVDGAGVAEVALALPPEAPPGAWTLEVGPARGLVRVLPAPAPGVEVTLTAPPALVTAGPARLQARVEVRLVTGQPLAGRAVRWAVRAADADAPAAPRPGPLPPFALVARGPARTLAAGEAALDARGEAALDVALPALDRPTLLRVEAEALPGALPAGAAPAAVAFVAAGPRDLLVDLRPARRVGAPTESVEVVVRGSRLDGSPAAREDLALTIEQGGRSERRTLRVGPDGLARATVLLEAPGEVALRLAGGDGVAAVDSVRVLAPAAPVDAAPPDAVPGAARLVLEAPLAPGAADAPLLCELPFERGAALVTCDGAPPQVVVVRGGRARVVVPAGERQAVLTAVRGGRVLEARARIDAPPARLGVDARAEGTGASVRVTGPDGGGRLAGASGWLFPEATARLLARGDLHLEGDDATRAAPAPALAWPALSCLGGDAGWTNGLGLGALRLPEVVEPAWLRVTAHDRRGQAGAAWCALRPEAAPLRVALAGPAHVVDGDRVEVAARVDLPDARALPAGAALRVTWKGEGLEVRSPRVEGARTLLLGDPGALALRLEPAASLRVLLPALVASGPPGPSPGRVRLEVRVEVEGAGVVATGAWAAPARARGRVERAAFAGEVPPDGVVTHVLDLPRDAVAARLELTVDPDPATAALAGAAALEASPDPLRGPLRALLARRRVAALLRARRLAPPARADLPPRWPDDRQDDAALLARALGALAACRDADGAWGPATSSLSAALAEARAEGLPVPDALVDPALAALERRPDLAHPDLAHDGRALLALALAGRLDPGRADAAGAPPDQRPLIARALALAGAPREAEDALAAAVAGAPALTRVEARAELLLLLAGRGELQGLQAELLAAVLAARAGPGWSDPDDAGAAVRALALVAGAEADAPGTRVDAALEGREVLSTWSGAGLAEWTGPAVVDGPLVVRRARLELRARGPRPARFAGCAVTLVRDAGPPLARGLALTRRLERQGTGGSREPIGVAGVVPGDVVRLVVELSAPAGGALALDDLLLEVPLPGGCLLVGAPPGARLEAGVLVLAPLAARVELDLLAVLPGEHRLLRARARALREHDRVATSDEGLLRIR